jgi:hypothetical protein
MRAFTIAVFVLLFAVASGCDRAAPLTEESQFRAAAMKEIRRHAALLKVDPDRLPPLVPRRTEYGYDYRVTDPAQNIFLHVTVWSSGAAEIGSEYLDQRESQ